jgi:two-component system phosphate regulon sensor histidine kinase PhoR
MILFTDSFEGNNILFFLNDKAKNINNIRSIYGGLLNSNQQIINRLQTYMKGGYKKIEPIGIDLENNQVVVFLIDNNFSEKNLCILSIDPHSFILQSLAPKMQEVSQEDFIITAVNDSSGEQIYLSEPTELVEVQQKKALWLFPMYSLGIILKSGTVEDLVKSRSYLNLFLIGSFNILMIIGLWFLYRNIKKQIELAQIKADFVSNVSHELRTPLSLISMFAETLEMDRVKNENKRREYYKIISQETNRLSRIVNSILNFSKMEADKRKYNFEQVNVNNLIEEILSTYQFHLENQGFEVNFEKVSSLPAIKADREAVSEAVINLLDNAIKYSKEIKEISIKTGREKNHIYCEIKDKGIGITEEEQKKIFEKFYRASSGSIHNTKGTGLGLSIVKHIMNAHNGRIEFSSEIGIGSCFKLLFRFNESN